MHIVEKNYFWTLFVYFSLGRVRESERLYRIIDDNEPIFRCPDGYVPVFATEALNSLNETFRLQAEELCGNDFTCLFDAAGTGQLSIGQSTLTENTELSNEISELGKILF